MIYAFFMLAVTAVLYALWHRHRLAVPLFLTTLAVLAVFLVSDMTSSLSLSF